jgi:hypothetical protein
VNDPNRAARYAARWTKHYADRTEEEFADAYAADADAEVAEDRADADATA